MVEATTGSQRTANTGRDFVLSVEEIVFLMGYVGGVEAAAGYLTAILGQLPAEELMGRITAASHSLLSRGLLTVDTANTITLNPVLDQCIHAIVNGEDTIRYSTMAAGVEKTVTFFLSGTSPVRHELEQDVVSHVQLLKSNEELVEQLFELVQDDRPIINNGSTPVGVIGAEQLRQARLTSDSSSVAELAAELRQKLPGSVAEAVAVTMKNSSTQWGTVMRLEPGPGEVVEANKAFFTATEQTGGWVFDLTANSNWADVYRLNKKAIQQAARRLLNDIP